MRVRACTPAMDNAQKHTQARARAATLTRALALTRTQARTQTRTTLYLPVLDMPHGHVSSHLPACYLHACAHPSILSLHLSVGVHRCT